jgi:hypothetical protein
MRIEVTTDAKTTEAVLSHHLDSFLKLPSVGVAGVAELLADYAPDAKIFTPHGVIEGEANRKSFFEDMIPLAEKLLPTLTLDVQEVRGEVAYIVWSAGATAPLGTDTFVVRDGKIVVQTFAAYLPS